MDSIREAMEVEADVQRRVLSDFSLDYILSRSLNSDETPPRDVNGFTRISNPYNWPPIFDQPIAEPLYLEIPKYFQSIETLRFLGFQRSTAEHIFADFISLERKYATSPSTSLVDVAIKHITDAAEVAAEHNSQGDAQPLMDIGAKKCIHLVRDCIGINFEGPAFNLIDEPERPLTLSTVAEWVICTTKRRWEFLCNLDSVIRSVEMANRSLEDEEEEEEEDEEEENREEEEGVEGQPSSSMDAADKEAKRKARNRKKAKAKKASKQKKKALAERQTTEGDNEGQS